MALLKKKEPSEKELAGAGIYKGYDVRWLRQEEDHPDHELVKEFDKKYGEEK